MKSQPRTRKTPNLDQLRAAAGTTIPKATGPDPAALNAITPSNAGVANNASVTSDSRSDRHVVTKNLTVRIPVELADRARSAWRLAAAEPGGAYPTFSAWIAALIENGVTDIEAAHNEGRPLVPTPAGTIPTGRPAC